MRAEEALTFASDSLKKLLPKISSIIQMKLLVSYCLSTNERQNIWFSKYHHGEELTENEVMSTYGFTNMYQELDRGT